MEEDDTMTGVEEDRQIRPFRTPFRAPYASFTTATSSDTANNSATPATSQTLSQPQSQLRTSKHMAQSSPTPGYSIAHLSFMPATQTTVVTTTTTTTVNCPPLVTKEPQHLTNLDPKMFPLASSPTPALIRKFEFEFGGQKAAFEEAEDAAATSERLQRQNQEMLQNGGMVRSVKRLKTEGASRSGVGRSAPTRSPPGLYSRQLAASPQLGLDSGRVATPPAARRQLSRTQSGQMGRSSRLQVVQTSTPITPSIADNDEDGMREGFGQSGGQSPTLRPSEPAGLRVNIADAMEKKENHDVSETKPARQHANQALGSSTPRNSGGRRPLPLDTNEAQDASLPSPSLSPVHASANLVARRGYFDDSQTLVNRSPPNELADDHGEYPYHETDSKIKEEHSSPPLLQQSHASQLSGHAHSVMDIPSMIESFDTLPANIKSYVMFQFLRRCEKPVLQFVADNVNPALKCDFISLLPPELCQQILGFLDVKSLCHAAQVSKKWRSVIDTSEKTWKDLLTQDGFHVGPTELRRAIAEGWGWQIGSRVVTEDWEKDIGRNPNQEKSNATVRASASADEEEAAPDSPVADSQDRRSPLPTSPPRRITKRKPAVKTRIASRKLQKRRDIRVDELPVFDATALVKHVTTTDGPFAVAQVATMALPNPINPEVGLGSLRNMHFYKSLYRRQHLIDSNWMSTKLKPKHIAFKAHERHVVTCLHFDSERILTGSDDTNINVYDTKTGIQRNILKGHDGGVWALKCYGNTLVSGSTDRTVRVWDIEAGKCLHTFPGHTSTVRCLVILLPTVIGHNSDGRAIISPREPLIITGSRDSTLRIWKLPQPKDQEFTASMSPDEVENHYFVRALTGHTHSVRAIAAHGDTLISGSYDHTVRVWRVSTGEQQHILRGHTQKVYSVVLDMQRNRCISGSMDYTVKIWSLTDGSLVHNLEGHNSLVGLLDLKGDRLVSAAADSTLRIWDPESGHCKATLSAHTGAITCFQHDARKVISGSDRTLKMWDTKTGEFVRDLLTDLSGVWQVGFDGRRCVAAVQRDSLTYIEILDFGAARDGVPEHKRGVRIEVDQHGEEILPSPGLEEQSEMFMALADVPASMI